MEFEDEEAGMVLYNKLTDVVRACVLNKAEGLHLEAVIKIGLVSMLADFCYGVAGKAAGKQLVDDYCKATHNLIDYLDANKKYDD